jgi:uncharacterized protein (TIGR02646 family)
VAVFQYPKGKHQRKLSPRQFKHYQSYKRYLQTEFVRVCVYCRQPDSSAPNLNFGVDHYRPKGIHRFASLVCEYKNLYYCCGSCNSRKNNDWPVDEKIGPYVVNPCDYDMAAHLRFNARTGKIEARTPHGKHTEELLQLNDDSVVQYRLGTLTTVRLYTMEIQQLEHQLKAIAGLLKAGTISQLQYDAEVQAVNQELTGLRHTLQAQTGELPLPPLRKKRLGVSLISP